VIPCLFASDLHGNVARYHALFDAIRMERPTGVFLGGDLLPSHGRSQRDPGSFIDSYLRGHLESLRDELGTEYPRVFLILGNDDPRAFEPSIIELDDAGLCEYLHSRRADLNGFDVYGYACVPPTPFLNKDWERYDVSRFVDPGCVSPEEGFRSVHCDPHEIRERTIAIELDDLVDQRPLERAVLLLHTPPYQTKLDRAALDGRFVDHAPLDVHVGSIAVRRLIESRGPLVTLHGHIHESARLTGAWKDQIGATWMFNGAHDGPELALVRFDLYDPGAATRELIRVSS
jgi:Icc-related predicted phosphoesterase